MSGQEMTTNKVCDSCGLEIPDSANRAMTDLDTYWCDECEATNEPESMAELMQRLADREALGVESRPVATVLEWHGDDPTA